MSGFQTGDLSREHYYYWDREKKQIKYLVLTNHGHLGWGILSSEHSLLVETGPHKTPDGTNLDAKATGEVSDEGRLISRGYTWKGGEWQYGRVIVFEALSTDKQ